jgi:hypothetical protein
MTTVAYVFRTYRHYGYIRLDPKRKVHPTAQFTNESSCNTCQRQGINTWGWNLLVSIPLEIYMNVGRPHVTIIFFH